MANVTVSYRFGDSYWVTDFVTPHNPDIEQVITNFGNAEGDEFVEKVAAYIRDNFEYPIVSVPLVGEMPSADGQLLRYTQGFIPATTHKITSVKLKLWKEGSPGTVTISIRATDGRGHPTGGDLCSGTINGNTIFLPLPF
ncbi:unnamed protein product [marine sediment metagenome]|uniref:Uncharacterized protein n=1 Tax=marine sediment metagenome TaxID=412755 RepID=X1VRN6_9ZZZZ